jgi:pseudomonalisin/xanthomonalisin
MKKPAIVGAAAAAMLFGVLGPAGAAGTPGWVSTATHGMPLATNVAVLGPLPATTAPLRVTVGLQMNQTAAHAYLQRIVNPADPLYGQYLTPQQFTNAFAPSASAAQTVATYLASAGLTQIAIAPNRQVITAVASPAAIAHAFNTQLNVYRVNGRTFYANATPAQVPTVLGTIVLGVAGLDSLGTMRTNLDHTTVSSIPQAPGRIAAASQGSPRDNSSCTNIPPQGLFLNPAFFTQFGLPVPPVTGVTFPTPPAQIPVQPNICLLANLGPIGYQTVYGALNTPTASNTSIAILAEGKLVPQVLPNDLRQFEKENNVPQVSYSVIPTAAQSTLTDTSGQDEFDLDTQYSTGMASKVKHLYVYDGPSLSDADLANEINRWVVDDLTKTGSLSVGGCEFIEAATGGLEIMDNILIQAAVQGQSLFVSSGDEGSACALEANTGTPVGVQSVEYPSSSPYVVSVGGTSLIPTSSLQYSYEVSWVGGGGGISYFETAPPWQFANMVPSAQLDHRGVPDVAMPADPNFGGAAVVVSGADEGVGGTSLAAPLSNGVWARLESNHKNALGFAPPALYNVYAANFVLGPPNPQATSQLVGGFHDIYDGSNGLYAATVGWDYTTGLGSFDVAAMQKVIK